jgi:hypothetical protein
MPATCPREHRYTVEVIGQTPRYVGTDASEAVAAVLTLDADNGDGDEGYAVAEHDEGDRTSYCRAESQNVEIAAMSADFAFAN